MKPKGTNCDGAMGISGWVTVIHLTEGKTLTGCFSEVEAEQPFEYLHSLWVNHCEMVINWILKKSAKEK